MKSALCGGVLEGLSELQRTAWRVAQTVLAPGTFVNDCCKLVVPRDRLRGGATGESRFGKNIPGSLGDNIEVPADARCLLVLRLLPGHLIDELRRSLSELGHLRLAADLAFSEAYRGFEGGALGASFSSKSTSESTLDEASLNSRCQRS
eukprot:CAMPEP_0115373936 /NCGR_PEP_ID=MMETSP0271-20121206/1693_1 /TAXON_ID=71861 /ORGANISM="Scrippsiella trochoidea, Strain CCMP3099" /LENGTH=148 /DNA_ID=CAMNT_0002796963 /DNA_START=143 /DNA_END=589 /DNA_ORIENTATION=+